MVQREYIVREVKVEQLRKIIVECSEQGLPALKTRLIAHCGKEWGTERRKALEYLNQLVAEESIMIDGEEIWSMKRWVKIEKARKLDYLGMEDIIKGYAQINLLDIFAS